MIKEGKKRVIVTLERDIADRLEVWKNGTGYTKSDLVNIALRYTFIMKGDTFDDKSEK